jgi:hypothetical protein
MENLSDAALKGLRDWGYYFNNGLKLYCGQLTNLSSLGHGCYSTNAAGAGSGNMGLTHYIQDTEPELKGHIPDTSWQGVQEEQEKIFLDSENKWLLLKFLRHTE